MRTAITGEASRAGSLALVGNALALDFANTASGCGTPSHREHLQRAGNVVAWARHARVLTAGEGESIARALRRNPQLGARLLTRARALRDLAHVIGIAVASGRDPDVRSLQRLARLHCACMACARLRPLGGSFVWTWNAAAVPLQAILGPIAHSALALLTEADLSRVKVCHGKACGWLFLDVSKNKRRRWCEMEVCGNRAKQRRFHARKHREGKA